MRLGGYRPGGASNASGVPDSAFLDMRAFLSK